MSICGLVFHFLLWSFTFIFLVAVPSTLNNIKGTRLYQPLLVVTIIIRYRWMDVSVWIEEFTTIAIPCHAATGLPCGFPPVVGHSVKPLTLNILKGPHSLYSRKVELFFKPPTLSPKLMCMLSKELTLMYQG